MRRGCSAHGHEDEASVCTNAACRPPARSWWGMVPRHTGGHADATRMRSHVACKAWAMVPWDTPPLLESVRWASLPEVSQRASGRVSRGPPWSDYV
jgi:hypothetical protein